MAAATRYEADSSNHKPLFSGGPKAVNSAAYARYVGRVGALAVALGVGVAVASGGSGLAWADPGSTGDSQSAGTSAAEGGEKDSAVTSKEGSSADDAETGGDGGDDDAPDADDFDGDEPAMNFASSGSVDNSVNDAGQSTDTTVPAEDEEDDESDLSDELESDVEDEDEEEGDGQEGSSETVSAEQAVSQRDSGSQSGSLNESVWSSGHIDDAVTAVEDVVERDADDVTEPQESSASLTSQVVLAVENLVEEHQVSTTLVTEELEAAPESTGVSGTIVDVAGTFVAALLSPFLAPSPDAPAEPPLAWALLAFARREWQHMLLNRTPAAVVDDVTTSEDTPITVDVAAGTDPDAVAGDVVIVTEVTQPQNGTVTVEGGTLTYTPNSAFHGTDTFTYTISDEKSPLHLHGLKGLWAAIFGGDAGHAATVTVSVTVTPVNDAPVAVDDAVTVDEDSGANVIDVLGNDTDSDGDQLAVTAVGGAVNGAVTLTDGAITYTPNSDFNGTDEITYTVSDGNGGTSTATVYVRVSPVNDIPIADRDYVSTRVDTSVVVDVLRNDTDVDGDSLVVADVTAANYGTVTLSGEGVITYAPPTGFRGEDWFEYAVTDGNGGVATARVYVMVDSPPVAKRDVAVTEEGIPVVIDVLANDSDVAGLRVQISHQPSNGTAEVNADGTITYTPTAGFTGSDHFRYELRDDRGPRASALVDIQVRKRTLVADDIMVGTDENSPGLIDIHVRDTLPGGDTDVTIRVDNPENGVVRLVDQNEQRFTLKYTPPPHFIGTDSFTYQVVGADGRVSNPYTVTVTVNSVTGGPRAIDDTVVVDANSNAVEVVALVNDFDVDDGELTVVHVSDARNGTVAVVEGVITYKPNAGFDGLDSFTYTVANDLGAAATGMVTVTVKDADAITFEDGAQPSETLVSHDPNRIVVLTGNELRIVDRYTGQIDTVDLDANPSSIALSRHGDYAYVGVVADGSDGSTVRRIDLWEAGTSSPIGAVGQATAMAVAEFDDRTLYVADYQDATVSVIDTRTGDQQKIDIGLQSKAIAVSEHSETLYVGTMSNEVWAVDLETESKTLVYTGAWDGTSVADSSITVAGEFAYVTDRVNNTVAVINTYTDETYAVYDIWASPTSVAASQYGDVVLVAAPAENKVTVISLEMGAVGAFEVDGLVDVDFARENQEFYVTTRDGISTIPTDQIYALFQQNPM